ncbi:DUF1357 family protein [Borrelia turicatae]|uniref:Uncharacterized protein n=1 Tax=Borrelia turicatae (strain 91E135) TaxID=314724 RepID=A0ABF7QZY3_BORT9|nr:DUF1357 family protein [Borrelia turicatae]ASJ27590.1 hypothetical protein BT0_P02 [Borrelia turicatae 91E135]UPA13720.1 DUF1357 family protein [Borrelia turicatae 91E135]UPA13763.1 DUF1357 family protein [Borrelia turicatae 91E135]UPA13808.1 DUF1357 family protein [Borrelia turicatae 91E135]UPA13863.1 DUF1357 family protein [Borrelia turicatae 91E135]
MEVEKTNDSLKTATDTEAVSKTPVMVSISAAEYEEYKAYKASKESDNQALSINERVSKELAEVQERALLQDKLLKEATRINEIDTLASKYLSNHFNKETLLSKGYSLDEILLAQSRELVRKYVLPEEIKAIAKVESAEHLEGKILEQLLDLAKVNIKHRKRNESMSDVSSKNGSVKFRETISISDPNFRPINRSEITEGMIQFYINQQKQNSKRINKRSA